MVLFIDKLGMKILTECILYEYNGIEMYVFVHYQYRRPQKQINEVVDIKFCCYCNSTLLVAQTNNNRSLILNQPI